MIFVSKSLHHQPISKVIYTDASNIGFIRDLMWGYVNRGVWLLEEKQWHMNELELKAIFLGLKFFIKEEKTHIKVFSDSTTAIGCINKIGTSHSDICHHFTKLIWKLAKSIHITAAHIPGNKNIEADRESRELSISWLRMDAMFEKLIESLGIAKLYTKCWLICKQCKLSISCLLFLQARPWSLWCWFIDNWLELPEILCLSTVFNHSKRLEKIKAKNAEGILVVPYWPNQPWFPHIFKIMTDAPVLLTSRKHLLHLPQHPQTLHPIWRFG